MAIERTFSIIKPDATAPMNYNNFTKINPP